LELRGSVGGAALTVSDSFASSGTSANAYSTGWQPSNHATTNGAFGSFTLGDVEQYIVTHFTTAQSVAQIAFTSVANARTSCASFDVLVSNDNAVWYALAGYDCNVTSGATQTFNLPTTSLGGVAAGSGVGGATTFSALTDVNVTESSAIHGKSIYWDNTSSKWVTALPAPSATSWRVRNFVPGDGSEFTDYAELQFRTAAGVAETPSGGTVLFGTVGWSSAASNAFDGNVTTNATHDNFNGHQADDWIGYQFAAARTVVEVAITARNGGTAPTPRAPINFVIEYLDTGSGNWIALNYYTPSAWSNAQTQTFVVSAPAALQIANMNDFTGAALDTQVMMWSLSTHKWGPVSIYATATPNMDGSGTVGTSTLLARSDHVHPSDTSRAPVANPTFTGNVKFSVGTALTAAGTTQSGALALTKDINEFTSVAAGAGGALPTAVAGMEVTVINFGANTLLIYPVNGGSAKINALTANTAISVPASSVMNFYAVSSTQWYSK
jgi:hypothetical protein